MTKADEHAWNAVFIDTNWLLVDTTWSAGHLIDKAFKKEFNDYYFFTPSEQLIFTHFPKYPKWQLVTPMMELAAFEKQPLVERGLFQLGFSTEQVRKLLGEKEFPGFVKAFARPGTRLRVQQAPLGLKLREGNEYAFRVKYPEALDMAVFVGKDFRPMKRDGDAFELSVVARGGTVKIGAKEPKKGELYWWILEYVVEAFATRTGPRSGGHRPAFGPHGPNRAARHDTRRGSRVAGGPQSPEGARSRDLGRSRPPRGEAL